MAKSGQDLKIAIEILKGGDLVAIPTETVYGLAANAYNADAVVKIFEVKNRPSFDPLIVHVSGLEHAEEIVTHIPDKAKKLASRSSPAYWDLSKESTDSQFKLFKKFDKFGAAEYKKLALYCQQQEIIFSSTPFDFEAVDYLYDLMPFYKISSSDLTNIPFILFKRGKRK